jgi:hypothetical protein
MKIRFGETHPTPEELLSYPDGELSRKQAEHLRAHLETCWSCRAQVAESQDAIRRFIRFRDQVLTPAIPLLPQVRRNLERDFDRLDAEALHFTWSGRLSRLFISHRPSWRMVTLCLSTAAVIIAFLIVFQPFSSSGVSVAELLRNTEQAQIRSFMTVPQPVVYQKLHIRRTSKSHSLEEAATLEIWNDQRGGKARRSSGGWTEVSTENEERPQRDELESSSVRNLTKPPVLGELETLFQANRMDARAPLSVQSYQSWRQSLQQKKEEVTITRSADGSPILILRTTPEGPTDSRRITDAEFIVRQQDWHPLEEKLSTEDQEYRITELQYEVLPLANIAQSIFPEPVAVAPVISPAANLKESVTVPSLPGPTDLAAAEVDARVALHEVGADLGEQIEVAQTPAGQIEVRGLANSEGRKLELSQALRDIHNVVVNIQSVEEASKRDRPTDDVTADGVTARGAKNPSIFSQSIALGASQADVVTTRLPIQQALETYFAEQRRQRPPSEKVVTPETSEIQKQIADLSGRAVESSNRALLEAWALRHLAQRYSADELSKLPPASRQKLQVLIRDHVRMLRERMENVSSLLRPVLISIVGNKTAQTPPLPAGETAVIGSDLAWPALPWGVIDKTTQVDRLINGLFAGAGLPLEDEHAASGGKPVRVKSPESCAADLLASLEELRAALPQIEKVVAGQFLTNP